MAGIPWYSVAEIVGPGGKDARTVLTGPARYTNRDGWWLPKLEAVAVTTGRQAVRRQVEDLRREGGFNPQQSENPRSGSSSG